MKQGGKGIISWNNYTSEIKAQLRNINLDYKIDLTFQNINRPFHIFFNVHANNHDDFPERDYFCKCYMQLIEIKHFNALFDKKSFFDQLMNKTRNF